ncbi:MAG: hypothetical protein M9931_02645 [Chitinophagales bacterium]|nr:hypothetical protein [Chitinophagales bacterium]MCO5279936.1 hypothetical protein [Chitinophagales bacterium]HRN95628.1 hypothetical protein [Chitinophagales bacterium]
MGNLKNNSLKGITRIFALLGGIGLFIMIIAPIWRIELTAPQYPEGLEMTIYSYKVGGQVQIINGLNHYIGMREIHEDDFIEFKVLPYILGVLGLLGVAAAIINKKWFFYTWTVLFLLFGILSMVDFYLWLYDYGHNLDPNAAIQVPGMTYQPPLIGFKQLLNFGAYSIPAIGGWIMIATGVILSGLSIYEFKFNKK